MKPYKKPGKKKQAETVGPGQRDYIASERAAAGGFKKMDKLKPLGPDVIGLAKKVKPPTIKKSTVETPAPAKKRRLKLRKRK